MKPFRFHRQADEEFTAAAQHYAAINPALGQRFYITIHELFRCHWRSAVLVARSQFSGQDPITLALPNGSVR